MTTVIQVVAVNQTVILDGLPTGRLNHSDCTSILCGHKFGADVSESYAAPSEVVKFAVILKCFLVSLF